MRFKFGLGVVVIPLLLWLGVNAQHPKKNKVTTKPAAQSNPQTQNDSKNPQWLSSACKLERFWFEEQYGIGKGITAEVYSSYTRQKALNTRQQIINSSDWINQLPCCPETSDLASESPVFSVDNWFEERVLSCYHPGAESAVRTTELYHAVSGRHSGQQCTYDKTGKLIPPNQPGAGTPDFFSPEVSGEQHLFFDTFSWTKLTLAEYNSVWKPNPGCGSPMSYDINPTIINNVWLYVRRGDVINISATGRIKFDVEGNETGPEGSLVIPKTDVGILGRLIAPNPLPTAKPGALLGGIYTGKLESANQYITIDDENLFYAGKAGDYTMPATGYLGFAVNDGYPQNNSGVFAVSIYRKLAR